MAKRASRWGGAPRWDETHWNARAQGALWAGQVGDGGRGRGGLAAPPAPRLAVHAGVCQRCGRASARGDLSMDLTPAGRGSTSAAGGGAGDAGLARREALHLSPGSGRNGCRQQHRDPPRGPTSVQGGQWSGEGKRECRHWRCRRRALFPPLDVAVAWQSRSMACRAFSSSQLAPVGWMGVNGVCWLVRREALLEFE